MVDAFGRGADGVVLALSGRGARRASSTFLLSSFDRSFLRTLGIDKLGLLTPLPVGIAAYLMINIKQKYSTAAGSCLNFQSPRRSSSSVSKDTVAGLSCTGSCKLDGSSEAAGVGSYPVPGCEGQGAGGLLEGRLFVQEIARRLVFRGGEEESAADAAGTLPDREGCLIPALFP